MFKEPNFRKQKLLGYLTCFISGAFLMSLELLAFRFLIPQFGGTVYVIGIIMTCILGSMALSYSVSGYCADRFNTTKCLIYLCLLLAASLFAGLLFRVNVLSMSVLLSPFELFLATMLLAGVPISFLSGIPVFFIRIFSSQDKVGGVSGNFFMSATLGNIFGALFTTLLLLPHLNAAYIYDFYAYSMGVIALVFFLFMKKIKMAFTVGALIFLNFSLVDYQAPMSNIVFSEPSPYSQVFVKKNNKSYQLSIGSPHIGIYSFKAANLTNQAKSPYYFHTSLTKALKSNDYLILGASAGGDVDLLYELSPQASIDLVDIDPVVKKVAEKYFISEKNIGKYNYYVDDARVFLKKIKKKYDYIYIDLFKQRAVTPYYVQTQEFFKEVRSKLKIDGILTYNSYGCFTPDKISSGPEALAHTLNSVFPTVFASATSDHTTLFIAMSKKMTKTELLSFLEPGLARSHYEKTLFDVKQLINQNVDLVQTDYKNNLAQIIADNLRQVVPKVLINK